MFRRAYCELATVVARPYIRHELPGWGRVYDLLIGGYRRNWLWRDFGVRRGVDKIHGATMEFDLASWSNRIDYFLGRYHDLGLTEVVRGTLRPGDTFVDIGANEGVLSLLAARLVSPGGKVISFEPNSGPRSVLEKHVAANRLAVDIRPIGLSDEPATLTLFVPAINTGEGTFGDAPYAEGKRIDCRVGVADEELAGEMPTLIKIDVEGFEHRVIAGLRGTLERARPHILIEMVDSHLRRAGSSLTELRAMLEGMGYKGRRVAMEGGIGHRAATTVEDTGDGDYLWSPE